TIAHQDVRATTQLVRRALTEIALPDLGIVADLLDDVVGPVICQTETFADAWRNTERLRHCWRRRIGLHLIDVCTGDAGGFSLKQDRNQPVVDVDPLIIALAQSSAE